MKKKQKKICGSAFMDLISNEQELCQLQREKIEELQTCIENRDSFLFVMNQKLQDILNNISSEIPECTVFHNKLKNLRAFEEGVKIPYQKETSKCNKDHDSLKNIIKDEEFRKIQDIIIMRKIELLDCFINCEDGEDFIFEPFENEDDDVEIAEEDNDEMNGRNYYCRFDTENNSVADDDSVIE